jgi:hypothetical protein
VSIPIPPPDVQFIEPGTGRPTKEFYDYLKSKDRGVAGPNGGSNTSAWFYGSAVPSNSLGVEDDFYIRTSGTSIIAFFVKTNGVWT